MTKLNAETTKELHQLAKKLVPDSLFIVPPLAETPQDEATKLSSTDIVERFSTNSLYSSTEQAVIDQAIEILASHLVDQDENLLMTSSQTLTKFLQLKLATCSREVFGVVFLNTENRLIKYEELFIGTLDNCTVYPRDIVARALELNAANIVITHNHPSGTLEASTADDMITERLMKIAKLFDIQLLDHIIVSAKGTMSYAERGKMPF